LKWKKSHSPVIGAWLPARVERDAIHRDGMSEFNRCVSHNPESNSGVNPGIRTVAGSFQDYL
jgi:hypothetical protein